MLTKLKISSFSLNQVVEGFLIGLHKSPFHGFSVGIRRTPSIQPGREYQGIIDWKVFARTDRLYTKKYEEETNMRCQILIDMSSSMYFPKKDIAKRDFNKLQFSCLAAASLMNLLKRQRDAFGVSLFDSSPQNSYSYQIEYSSLSADAQVYG